MIRVTVERVNEIAYTEQQNMLTHREPTDKVDSEEGGYSGRCTQKRCYIENYEVVEMKRTRTEKIVLLTQEIVDEDKFSLSNVVMAVNGLFNYTQTSSK